MADIAYLEFEAMRDHGVLWAINRVLFHPRGFALAFVYDDDGGLIGWAIQGDGTETWAFSDGEEEDDLMRKFEALLDAYRPESGR